MSFKQDENGKWYFENTDGTRVTGGWVKDNEKWYYLGLDGFMVTGWLNAGSKENAKWFYLNPYDYDGATGLNKGEMVTGWIKIDDKWYYANPNDYDTSTSLNKGQMLTGWLKWENNWYYLNPEEYSTTTWLAKGQLLASTTKTIDGTSYTFDSNGIMQNTSSTIATGDGLISSDCLVFVKEMEGFTDNGAKYYDCCGVLTQGYGMTGDEIADLPDVIDEPTAASLLDTLINNKYATPIKTRLDNAGVSLTQNEFDSFVTFAYNCGTSALFGSSLWDYVIQGGRDTDTISADFLKWNKGEVNGVMQAITGLTKRRTFEADMFNNANYSNRL